MALNESRAQEVFDWYNQRWNLPVPLGKKRPLTLDSSLSTGEYPWARETGEEIMKDYFSRFGVDSAKFDITKYWPYEEEMFSDVLISRTMWVEEKQPEALTIMMLIVSAKAGRWLY